MTFSQHMHLATLWCQWNGQRGTERQALRVMRDSTAVALRRLLLERRVILPTDILEAQA